MVLPTSSSLVRFMISVTFAAFLTDSADGYVIDAKRNQTKLPRGSSDAALTPWHVDRSKLFVLIVANHKSVDAGAEPKLLCNLSAALALRCAAPTPICHRCWTDL